MKVDNILAEIERIRAIMHETALAKGISSPEVLHISRLLDKRLNEYHKRKRSAGSTVIKMETLKAGLTER